MELLIQPSRSTRFDPLYTPIILSTQSTAILYATPDAPSISLAPASIFRHFSLILRLSFASPSLRLYPRSSHRYQHLQIYRTYHNLLSGSIIASITLRFSRNFQSRSTLKLLPSRFPRLLLESRSAAPLHHAQANLVKPALLLATISLQQYSASQLRKSRPMPLPSRRFLLAFHRTTLDSL